MSILGDQEPVLAGEGETGSNGRGGRRSSSIIAGRRPARRDADSGSDAKASRSSGSSSGSGSGGRAAEQPDEKARTPRRRRRPRAAEPTSESKTETTAAAKAELKAAEPAPPEELEEPAEAEGEDEEAEAAPAQPAARTRVASRPTAAPPDGSAVAEIGQLRSLIEEQGKALREMRAGLLALGDQLDQSAQRARLGVFVDVPNLMYGQDPDAKPVNMGKLLEFLRKGREMVRATAYSPVSDNPNEPLEQQKFVAPFVPYEFRIVTKPLKRFADGSIKGNFDVEMAIDMLTMADRLDVIAIVSGDADFARAVEVVQTRGVRVEVVAFAGSSSLEMRSLADRYVELGAVINQVT